MIIEISDKILLSHVSSSENRPKQELSCLGCSEDKATQQKK